MNYYQKAIQPHLQAANEYAYRAAREVSRLPARPAFFTLAGSQLADAEHEAEQLLATIRAAKSEYARKPVERAA